MKWAPPAARKPVVRWQPFLAKILLILGIVLLIRLPFLNQAIQGDDPFITSSARSTRSLIPPIPATPRYIFQGEEVDMRGHPHPPLNAWVLAGLLAIFGDVYEVPFHAAYIVFSVIAAISMWYLAGRFSDWPLGATLLFLLRARLSSSTVPHSKPTCRFWRSGWQRSRYSYPVASSSPAIALALAAMTAYQAILATPILMTYCWLHPATQQSPRGRSP